MEDTEIEVILSRVDELVAWASDIKEYALQQAISGKEWTGWKLVEGRSNRKYSNEAAVIEAVTDAGFDPYEKKLLGITAMQKLLGKSRFDELLAAYIEKPQGKPKPTMTSVTATRVDGDVPAAWAIYVQNKSKATVKINGAAGAYGSTISSYSISGGGYSSTASSFTTGFLTSSGNDKLVIQVVSRMQSLNSESRRTVELVLTAMSRLQVMKLRLSITQNILRRILNGNLPEYTLMTVFPVPTQRTEKNSTA